MRCSEVRRLVTDSVLGDLDSEYERGVREHLKGCSDCRRAEAELARTVRFLKAPGGPAPSTERRDLAVAAMIRAQADRNPRAAGLSRRSWAGPVSAAAAFFLVATLAVVLFRAPGATAFYVASVTGQADLRHGTSGLWRPLLPGATIRWGDRVVTQGECQVRFDLGAGTMMLDQNTSVEWISGSRIALDRGRLRVDLHGRLSEPLAISDTANNSAVMQEGSMEVSLRKLSTALLAGSEQRKGQPSHLPPGRPLEVWRLAVRVEAGEAFLADTHDQRLRAVSGQEGGFDWGGPKTSLTPPGSTSPWPDLGPGDKR